MKVSCVVTGLLLCGTASGDVLGMLRGARNAAAAANSHNVTSGEWLEGRCPHPPA
jgi:hypothetical protein